MYEVHSKYDEAGGMVHQDSGHLLDTQCCVGCGFPRREYFPRPFPIILNRPIRIPVERPDGEGPLLIAKALLDAFPNDLEHCAIGPVYVQTPTGRELYGRLCSVYVDAPWELWYRAGPKSRYEECEECGRRTELLNKGRSYVLEAYLDDRELYFGATRCFIKRSARDRVLALRIPNLRLAPVRVEATPRDGRPIWPPGTRGYVGPDPRTPVA